MHQQLLTIILALTISALAATRNVIVGSGLTFQPEYVNAAVGDYIHFEFHQGNHSVTQSSFQDPCRAAQGGFNSDFHNVLDGATDFPYSDFQVRTTDPIWFFCQQTDHCRSGEVFAINPPNGTFDQFKAAATGMNATATPAPITVTVTVTWQSQTYTTTYASYPGSTDPTPAPQTVNHVVAVGGGPLAYSPSNITAKVGDTITFQFKQKNHTVTQSSFSNPCRKLEFTSNVIGFDSGFNPIADGSANFPEYTITVNNTAPIWAYCRQTNHCGSGMVFSANAVESGPNNFAAFQALAKRLNGTAVNQPTATPTGSAFLLEMSWVAIMTSAMLTAATLCL